MKVVDPILIGIGTALAIIVFLVVIGFCECGVSTGHNTDGQRVDFSGFPARPDEADVGP